MDEVQKPLGMQEKFIKPLSKRQKWFLDEYIMTGFRLAEACRNTGYSEGGGGKVLKKEAAKKYLDEQVNQRKEKEDKTKDSIIKAMEGVIKVDPRRQQDEKIENDLIVVYERYMNRLKKCDNLRDLKGGIEICLLIKKYVSGDPMNLVTAIKGLNEDQLKLAQAITKKVGLTKKVVQEKDKTMLFGRST